MHRDVAAHQVRQLAATEGTVEAEQQDRGIAAFKHVVGPAGTPPSRGRDEDLDVVDQERGSPIQRRGSPVAYSRRIPDSIAVRARAPFGTGARWCGAVVDGRDPRAEGGDGVGPSPVSVRVSAAPTRYAATLTGCARNATCPSRSHHPKNRRHAVAYVRRAPFDRDDCTAPAMRAATAGGICGSTARRGWSGRALRRANSRYPAWSKVHLGSRTHVSDRPA